MAGLDSTCDFLWVKTCMASNDSATVHIVDDDQDVCASVKFLVESIGLAARIYTSASDFFNSYRECGVGCLILDLRMPGISGLEAMEKLGNHNISIPVIVVTGHGDVPAAVRALKMGAFDFLEKPCNDLLLIEKINRAIELDEQQRAERSGMASIQSLLQTLSERERDVMDLLIEGNSNKQVARHLLLSPKTVERHRANIMRKLNVSSFAELVSNVAVLRALTSHN